MPGPGVAVELWAAHADHRAQSGPLTSTTIATSLLGASLLALIQRVVWRRQGENSVVATGTSGLEQGNQS
jgi:hypothetical protein